MWDLKCFTLVVGILHGSVKNNYAISNLSIESCYKHKHNIYILSLMALKTYFPNQLLILSDSVLNEHKGFCKALLFKWDGGLSCKTYSHISMHQSQFGHI